MTPPRKFTRKQLAKGFGLFLQYYLWAFSYLLFHRDLQHLFSKEPSKRWYHVSMNAHLIMTMTAFRILNEFFRKSDYREDIRAHHFGFLSPGQFIPKNEIDWVSRVFMHASYGALRLRRPHWNTHDWYERLARRAIPFLKFVRQRHFLRSRKVHEEIDRYVAITNDLVLYARKIAASENTA